MLLYHIQNYIASQIALKQGGFFMEGVCTWIYMNFTEKWNSTAISCSETVRNAAFLITAIHRKWTSVMNFLHRLSLLFQRMRETIRTQALRWFITVTMFCRFQRTVCKNEVARFIVSISYVRQYFVFMAVESSTLLFYNIIWHNSTSFLFMMLLYKI